MRKKIEFFVSYASFDRGIFNDFIKRFNEQISASSTYEYNLWYDKFIPIGNDWDKEIHVALERCDLGLLLVSPTFVASKYITNVELPKLVEKRKPVIPVMLKFVDFRYQRSSGLRKHQVFRLHGKGFEDPKAFSDCTTRNQRDRFVHSLFIEVENKLNSLFEGHVQVEPVKTKTELTTIATERDLKFKVKAAVNNADLTDCSINWNFPDGSYIAKIKDKKGIEYKVDIYFLDERMGSSFPDEQVKKHCNKAKRSIFSHIIATNASKLPKTAEELLDKFNKRFKCNKLLIITGQTRDAFIEKLRNIFSE